MAILGCNFNINFDQTLFPEQFTSGVLSHFQNAPLKAGFLVLKGQKLRPLPVTPELEVREVSQSGF